jgi:hypothetical protein
MTIFHWHEDRRCDLTGMKRLVRRAVARTGAVLAAVHEAIVTAKTRRLVRELRFYGGPHGDLSSDIHEDAANVARRPLILGDKWDF